MTVQVYVRERVSFTHVRLNLRAALRRTVGTLIDTRVVGDANNGCKSRIFILIFNTRFLPRFKLCHTV